MPSPYLNMSGTSLAFASAADEPGASLTFSADKVTLNAGASLQVNTLDVVSVAMLESTAVDLKAFSSYHNFEIVNMNTLSNSISAEVTRADSALSGSISAEVTRANSALSGSITAEVTRADSALTGSIDAVVKGTRSFEGTITFNGTNNVGSGASVKVNGDVNASSFKTTSDARLKTDIEEVANGLGMVRSLHPVFYNWNNGTANINPGHKELGFLAQEVEAVLPNVVSTDDSDEFHKKAVSYDRVVSLLVAAVKELDARLAALEPSA